MQAAVDRRSAAGARLGEADERLSPERALALFTSPPSAPGADPAPIAPGTAADLCLLDRPWSAARNDLSADRVAATIRNGNIIFRR